jgi:hypothetical protein
LDGVLVSRTNNGALLFASWGWDPIYLHLLERADDVVAWDAGAPDADG